MKFAILGAGAVGGYFGARLAEAGEDVTFMARGAHLEAIRSTGLRIESENGEAHIHPAQASDDPAEVGPVDYVLFAVKLFQTEETAGFAKPLVGPNTTLVALQNGVECANVLSAVHGKERVLNGTSYIAAVIAEPGLIRQTGTFASFAFGEQDGTMSDRGQRLKEAADKAGLNPTYSSNVESLVWMKFLLIATMSSITTSTRKPIGELAGRSGYPAGDRGVARGIDCGRPGDGCRFARRCDGTATETYRRIPGGHGGVDVS